MLQILICDDDPAFAESLAKKISALPDFSPDAMCIRCVTQPEALRKETFADCDLLFMDIDMGELNGIEIARRMRKSCPATVLIFVTNFIEYAPEGYEVDAFRYLSKQNVDDRLPRYFSDALTVCRVRRGKVEILCDRERMRLAVRSILYIESDNHEQRLHLRSPEGAILTTHVTLNELEDQLAPHGFLRIHKSVLVNMAYLKQLKSTGAELLDGTPIMASARGYRENKRKFLSWTVQTK